MAVMLAVAHAATKKVIAFFPRPRTPVRRSTAIFAARKFFSHQTHHAQGNGKNRENRLQLRCGNASVQTITRAKNARETSWFHNQRRRWRGRQCALRRASYQVASRKWQDRPRSGNTFRKRRADSCYLTLVTCHLRGKAALHHMRSPNIHPWALTRPARNFCARRNREIFIAKMKRESSALSPIARRRLQSNQQQQTPDARRHLSALATNQERQTRD